MSYRIGKILKIFIIANSLALSGCEPISTIVIVAVVISTVAQCTKDVNEARKSDAEADKAEKEAQR